MGVFVLEAIRIPRGKGSPKGALQQVKPVDLLKTLGPEDYHARINDEKLNIDENSILMIRGCGPVGYPG